MTEITSVLLAGGGTAGHVAPLLATADALRRRFPEARLTVLGTAQGLEARLVPEHGLTLETIPKVAFPRRPGGAALRFPATLAAAVRRSGAIIDEVQAQVVVGFGGYVCPPAYLAARRRKVPVVVHEANTRPGLANVLGARFAASVATTFSATKLPGARLTGLPMRREITSLDRRALREEALARFGLSGRRPVVLVTGGSLGAVRLNSAFLQAQAALAEAEVDVLLVTGRGKGVEPRVLPGSVFTALEYCDRMDLAYSAADLVVCRAGAGMVNEVGAVGLPAVFVPLPVGNGEQRRNAEDAVAAGAAVVVEDAQVDAGWVERTLVPLAKDPARLSAMREAARETVTDADDRLVDLVVEAVDRRG